MKHEKLIDTQFYIQLIKIAIPIALQNLIYNMVNMVDILMIGTLGEDSIAAVGAANQIYFLLVLFLFGISSGASMYAAQFFGKKDVKNIKRILGICLIMSVGIAIIFTIGTSIFPDKLLGLFIQNDNIIQEGSRYLRIVGASYIITSISFCYIFMLRSIHQTKLPMFVSIIALLVHITLNYLLVFGNFGIPKLGVEGAAIGTLIARTVESSILIIFIYSTKNILAAKFKEMFDLTRSYVKSFISKTIFVIGNEVIWSVGVTMYQIIYGRMGEDVFAAVKISQTVENIATVLFFGMASACGVMLGNQLGMNNKEKAYLYAKRFVSLVGILSIVMGVVLFFTSTSIINIYDVDPNVKKYASQCLIVFSIAIILKTFNAVNIVGILRSGGDTLFAMLIDTGAVWFVAVPLGFIAAMVFKLELVYVYAIVMSEEIVKAIIGFKRMISKKWLNNIVDNI